MSTLREVAVVDLHVSCSLRVRNFRSPGFAMSDACGDPATSAVRTRELRDLFRCSRHSGIVALQENGPILQTVSVRVDCPEEDE